ncbi:MAG: hypothetical protein RJB22_1035 [Pseudomonadota bacterium]
MSADRWRPIENGRQRLSPPPPMHLLLPLLSGLQIGLGFGGVGLGGVGFGGVGLDGVGLGGVGLGGVGFGGVGLEGLLLPDFAEDELPADCAIAATGTTKSNAPNSAIFFFIANPLVSSHCSWQGADKVTMLKRLTTQWHGPLYFQ